MIRPLTCDSMGEEHLLFYLRNREGQETSLTGLRARLRVGTPRPAPQGTHPKCIPPKRPISKRDSKSEEGLGVVVNACNPRDSGG